MEHYKLHIVLSVARAIEGNLQGNSSSVEREKRQSSISQPMDGRKFNQEPKFKLHCKLTVTAPPSHPSSQQSSCFIESSPLLVQFLVQIHTRIYITLVDTCTGQRPSRDQFFPRLYLSPNTPSSMALISVCEDPLRTKQEARKENHIRNAACFE